MQNVPGAGGRVLLPPPSISSCHVDLPQIDIPNVRSNLSKGGAPLPCMLTVSLHSQLNMPDTEMTCARNPWKCMLVEAAC